MLTPITSHTKKITAAAVLCLTLVTTNVARADDVALFHKVVQSTGWVHVPGQGFGTCWVVDRDERLVITNMHVVDSRDSVEVFFPLFKDGTLVTAIDEYMSQRSSLAIRGTVLTRDEKRDLALIQLERLPETALALPLAAVSAKVNDPVLSIGNSGMSGKGVEPPSLWKMRTGQILHKSFQVLTFSAPDQKMEMSMLRGSHGSEGGDSGGPVVNTRGELVAVTSCGSPKSSLAIDVTEVKAFLAMAIESPRRPPVGVRVIAGAWTQSWNNGVRGNTFAGITLRADGTLLYEDASGSQEGSYTLETGRLTLVIPGLGREWSTEVTWINSDSFRFSHGGTEYTMVRR